MMKQYIGQGVFFLVGMGLLALAAVWSWSAVASASWPTVTGVVTKSEVRAHRSSSGSGNYSPDIAYSYAVDGKKYSATRVCFVPIMGQKATVKRVQTYKVGSSVDVHHHPSTPSRAVLEAGFSFHFMLGLVMFFSLVGLAAGTVPSILRKTQST